MTISALGRIGPSKTFGWLPHEIARRIGLCHLMEERLRELTTRNLSVGALKSARTPTSAAEARQIRRCDETARRSNGKERPGGRGLFGEAERSRISGIGVDTRRDGGTLDRAPTDDVERAQARLAHRRDDVVVGEGRDGVNCLHRRELTVPAS